MATLTLTVAASSDDAKLNDSGYSHTDSTIIVGGNGASVTNMGQGFRFTNVTIAPGSTVNSVYISLVKNGTQWLQHDCRWTALDEDNTATFSSSSPPGSRPITSAHIAQESRNVNETDGTRYNYPTTTTLQETLGAAVNAVVNRAGWASGNALAIVCNSDQDPSAYTNFSRKDYRAYDYGTPATNAPQLTIDYTEGGGGTTYQQGADAATASTVTLVKQPRLTLLQGTGSIASLAKQVYLSLVQAAGSVVAALRQVRAAATTSTASTVSAAFIKVAPVLAVVSTASAVSLTRQVRLGLTRSTASVVSLARQVRLLLSQTTASTTSLARQVRLPLTVGSTSSVTAAVVRFIEAVVATTSSVAATRQVRLPLSVVTGSTVSALRQVRLALSQAVSSVVTATTRLNYSALVLNTAGLQSYWRLEETGTTVNDSKGSVTGTVSGATTGVAGIPAGGVCHQYDGTNDSTTFGDAYDFAGTAAFSVEVWFYPTIVDGQFRRIVSKGNWNGTSGDGWEIVYQSGYTAFTRAAGSTIHEASTATPLTANEWHHIVACYSGANMRLFVNGTEVASLASALSLTDTTLSLRVGSRSDGSNPAAGKIDEVAIYNTALPSATITEHYERGSTAEPRTFSVVGTFLTTSALAVSRQVRRVLTAATGSAVTSVVGKFVQVAAEVATGSAVTAAFEKVRLIVATVTTAATVSAVRRISVTAAAQTSVATSTLSNFATLPKRIWGQMIKIVELSGSWVKRAAQVVQVPQTFTVLAEAATRSGLVVALRLLTRFVTASVTTAHAVTLTRRVSKRQAVATPSQASISRQVRKLAVVAADSVVTASTSVQTGGGTLAETGPVQMSASTYRVGDTITGTATLRNSGDTAVTIDGHIVAGRVVATGENKDMHPANAWNVITLNPGDELTYSASRQVQSTDTLGQWKFFSAFRTQADQVWHDGAEVFVNVEAESGSETWTLVWEDDFNSASLDSTIWRDEGTTTWGSATQGYNGITTRYDQPNSWRIEDSILKLLLRPSGSGSTYYGCWLDTKDRKAFNFTDGTGAAKVEVMARHDVSPSGMWPAIWSHWDGFGMGGDSSLPTYEFDMEENYTSRPNETNQNYHYFACGGCTDNQVPRVGTMPDGWHTQWTKYSMIIDKGGSGGKRRVRYYINDSLVHTVTEGDTALSGNAVQMADKPYPLILDIKAGGWENGEPGQTGWTEGKLEIDWVRVYKRA